MKRLNQGIRVKWVIQSNFIKDDNINKLASFLDVLNVRWEQITLVPFSDEPLEVRTEPNTLTVFYGSVGLVKKVKKADPPFVPGVWFDIERFSFAALKNGYKENLLNYDSQIMKVSELADKPDWDRTPVLFIRPTEDSKAITGDCFTRSQVQELVKGLDHVDPSNRLQLTTLVQVAAPKQIVSETRHFVVNGKISTSSNYGHGRLLKDVEAEDIEFAQKMAEAYQPAEVFTLDTCQLEDGSRKVVETNCFNSSGFYWTDIHKLVSDINSFVLERH